MKTKLLFFIVVCLMGASASAGGFPAGEVYQNTSKAVVLIAAGSEGSQYNIGAGSIVASGLIVTNAHVVVDKGIVKPYPDIRIYLKPAKVTGKSSTDLVDCYKAKVLTFDSEIDLAVLKVDTLPNDTGSIKLADPENIRIGEEVVAIGHPEQGGLWTLTYGRISGEIENKDNVKGKDVYQTDTSVNRGNSGGPLLDARGYLVGINTNMARIGADNLPITGVNFAIKSSVIRQWLGKQGILVAYGEKATRVKERAKQSGSEGTKPQAVDSNQGVIADPENDRKYPGNNVAETTQGNSATPHKRPYRTAPALDAVEKEMMEIMQEMRSRGER